MDPELYVFPKIDSTPVKIAVSTTLFVLVLVVAGLLVTILPGPHLWEAIDRPLITNPVQISLAGGLHLLLGYTLFLYGSYHAWRATRLKNTVEDPKHELAIRLLDSGYYSHVRHPMYAMFILANTGIGFAMNSVYGLAFSLLSVVLFVANGIFEEHAVMIRFFGEAYQDYMRRVPARYFTRGQAIILGMFLAINILGLFFQ